MSTAPTCACGCGRPIPKRYNARWHVDACRKRATRINAAYGDTDPQAVDRFWNGLYALRRAARPDSARTAA